MASTSLNVEKKRIVDPQIRQKAQPYRDEIVKVWRDVKSGIYPTNTKNLFRCISFFAQFTKHLPEFSHDILNMCRACLVLIEINTAEWDSKVLNKLIIICTTLLICRKEESIIRESCIILIEVIMLLPSNIVNGIVQAHSKTLSFIFRKLVLVQTSYTQLQVFRVFMMLTQGIKNFRHNFVSSHRLVSRVQKEISEALLESLDRIDMEKFIITSREFHLIFNTYIVKEVFILASEGYVTRINDKPVEDRELMSIDFNGRNLSISFFVPKRVLFNLESKLMTEYGTQDPDENQLIFVEIECDNIEAKKKTSKSDKVLLHIEIKVAKIMHIQSNNSLEQRIFGFESMAFVMVDTDAKIQCFLEIFYNRFKIKDRMPAENNLSLTDQESLMSYKTNTSLLSNDDIGLSQLSNKQNEQANADASVSKEEIKNETSKLVIDESNVDKSIFPEYDKKEDKNNTKFVVPTSEKSKKPQKTPAKRGRKPASAIKKQDETPKARPKRKAAKKIVYKDEFDIPSIEDLPSYREFMNKKREERLMASQLTANDSSENFIPKKSPVQKPQAKKIKSTEKKQKRVAQKRNRADSLSSNDGDDIYMLPGQNKKQKIKKENPRKVPKSNANHTVLASSNQKPLPRKDFDETEVKRPKIVDRMETEDEEIFEFIKNTSIETRNSEVKDRKPEPLNKNVSKRDKDVPEKVKSPENICPKPTFIANSCSKNVQKFDQIIDKSGSHAVKENTELLQPLEVEEPAFMHNSNHLQSSVAAEKQERKALNKNVCNLNKRRLSLEAVDELKSNSSKHARIEEWLESSSSPPNFYTDIVHKSGKFGLFEKCNNDDEEKLLNVDHEDDDDVSNNEDDDEIENMDELNESSQSQDDFDFKPKMPPFQIQSNFNPCDVFRKRANELTRKFEQKCEELLQREKNFHKGCEGEIKKLSKDYLEIIQEIKLQVNVILQLEKRYITAKEKLLETLKRKEESSKELKAALVKRSEMFNFKKAEQIQDLMKLKTEIDEAQEALKKEVWREYVENAHKKMLNSFQAAFEI